MGLMYLRISLSELRGPPLLNEIILSVLMYNALLLLKQILQIVNIMFLYKIKNEINLLYHPNFIKNAKMINILSSHNKDWFKLKKWQKKIMISISQSYESPFILNTWNGKGFIV